MTTSHKGDGAGLLTCFFKLFWTDWKVPPITWMAFSDESCQNISPVSERNRMISKPLNIIYFALENWETLGRKPHIEALSKYGTVLCIEPPFTPLKTNHKVKMSNNIRKKEGLFHYVSYGRRLRQINDNLYVYKPIAFTPYIVSTFLPYLSLMNKPVIRLQLKSIINRLKMKNIVSFTSHPAMWHVVGIIGEECSCHEVLDDVANYPTIPLWIRPKISKIEQKLLKRVDIVFASSRNLYKEKKKLNPNTYFMPNGADVNFFMKSLYPSTVIPDDLKTNKRPRIGLIGHISTNVDIDLLHYIAKVHPEWSIVLIGEVEDTANFNKRDLHKLRLPNIHCIGYKAYETLPNYLSGFDVCLLPYRLNNYINYVYPNKLHQYLACGKPVVSTPLPEMMQFKNIIHIASDYIDFLKAIEYSLAEKNNDKIINKRIAVAKSHSVEILARRKVKLIRRKCLTLS